MDTSKILLEQAQIAQDINDDYDKFKSELEKEGVLTRAAYSQARALLDDSFTRFLKNHHNLIANLTGTDSYFTEQKYESTEFIVSEFESYWIDPSKT